MNTQEKDANYSRRDFLRAIAGLGVGAAVGATVTVPVAIAVNKAVEATTDYDAGNASMRERLKAECGTIDDPACTQRFVESDEYRFKSVVSAPINEELMFRGIPSVLTDFTDTDKPLLKTTLVGKEAYTLTRKEVLVGLASSALFGLAHNVYRKADGQRAFSTNTIPASQFADGFIFWYLTRKFGIGSSIAAHAAHNAM